MLFVLFIYERYLDMFNKMLFLYKMCEVLYYICYDVLECLIFYIWINKSCCYSFNDIVVFFLLIRFLFMLEYKKNKKKIKNVFNVMFKKFE